MPATSPDPHHDRQTQWEWYHDEDAMDGLIAIRLLPGTHPVHHPRQLEENPGRLYYMSQLLRNSAAPPELLDWQDWETFELDEEGGLIIFAADPTYEPPPETDPPTPASTPNIPSQIPRSSPPQLPMSFRA